MAPTVPTRSLSRMETIAHVADPITAPPVGALRLTPKVSLASASAASRIGTVKVLLVTPGAKINVPLVAMGKVLGTINLLDVKGHYGDADVAVVQSVAPYLVAPFLREL